MRIGWRVAAISAAIATAMLSACATAPPTAASNPGGGDLADGKVLYEQRCATCHGVRGDGHGPTASFYGKPAPRDFTRGLYELRTTESKELPLRSDLVRTIAWGMPGTTMPAFREILSPRDVDAVAQYIEKFSPLFVETPEKDRAVVPIPEVPAAPSAADLEEGQMFYFTFTCWNCHGVRGQGDGPGGTNLKDKWDRPIRPANLTQRRKYKGGFAPWSVYRSIATGLDGTPMSSYAQIVVMPPLKGPDGLPDLSEQPSLPNGTLDPTLRAKVIRFIETLPTREQISALSDDDRAKLRERRLWLLVGYVREFARRDAVGDVVDWLVRDPSTP